MSLREARGAPARAPTECQAEGTCGCAQLLDCGAREPLAALASALAPRAEEVASRWSSLIQGTGMPVLLAGEPQEVRAILELLALGDAPLLAAALLRAARRRRELGAPIQRTVAALDLLPEACLEALGQGPASSEALLLRRLRWLATSLAGVAYAQGPEELPASPAEARAAFCGLVGASQVMRRLYAQIELAARGRETALIAGESGAGKELVARAIHQASGDPPLRFVAVNCAALPRELIESELFGHRKGAFSGATGDHQGLVRAAEGGTLFLDEITELAPEGQAKLLRVIQERSVRAVGELSERVVSVRVVASTNRPLREAVEGGFLRRDLFYRLQRLVLVVPPLREHASDVPLLVEAFAERWRQAYGASRAKSFTQAALERLCLYDWPGNARELENVVFAACLRAGGPLVRLEDLPDLDVAEGAGLEPAGALVPAALTPVTMKEAERQAIVGALTKTQGNKSLAARLLGISRKQLYAKLRLYQLD